MRRVFVLALALLVTATAAAAQGLPTLTKPVNDFAGVIDATSAAELERRIRALEASTPLHDAVIVATVETIGSYGSIEEYTLKLFEQAGIGQKGQNNGLLLVMAKQERQVRIEVGYDLEGFVTDGFAGDTIRQEILPAFRQGNYGAGLLAGATRLINRIAEKRGVTLKDVPASPSYSRDRPSGLIKALPIILILIFFLLSRIGGGPGSSARRRRGWGGWGGPFIGGGGFGGGGFGGGFGGGGGGGGGFGGFGGGMSGGGGASGRW